MSFSYLLQYSLLNKEAEILEFLHQPLPWYVGGILIGLMVPALLIFGNKQFGISSSMRHLCAAFAPGDVKYFNYDWRKEAWNLFLVLGLIIGGLIATTFMSNPNDIAISEATKADLMKLGVTDFSSYIPKQVFSWDKLATMPGFLVMIVGGFLVGFGSRYANGCTSGHCIMGSSLLNAGSLISTVCFFIGGLIVTWFIYPLIFK
jgi:uncharacterized membrane protein YedE/YeeE